MHIHLNYALLSISLVFSDATCFASVVSSSYLTVQGPHYRREKSGVSTNLGCSSLGQVLTCHGAGHKAGFGVLRCLGCNITDHTLINKKMIDFHLSFPGIVCKRLLQLFPQHINTALSYTTSSPHPGSQSHSSCPGRIPIEVCCNVRAKTLNPMNTELLCLK